MDLLGPAEASAAAHGVDQRHAAFVDKDGVELEKCHVAAGHESEECGDRFLECLHVVVESPAVAREELADPGAGKHLATPIAWPAVPQDGLAAQHFCKRSAGSYE